MSADLAGQPATPRGQWNRRASSDDTAFFVPSPTIVVKDKVVGPLCNLRNLPRHRVVVAAVDEEKL
jgi:hypothetical protein